MTALYEVEVNEKDSILLQEIALRNGYSIGGRKSVQHKPQNRFIQIWSDPNMTWSTGPFRPDTCPHPVPITLSQALLFFLTGQIGTAPPRQLQLNEGRAIVFPGAKVVLPIGYKELTLLEVKKIHEALQGKIG